MVSLKILKRWTWLALWPGLAGTSLSQELWNGTRGDLPQAWGWTYAVLGVASVPTLIDGRVRLDSTALNATAAGFSRVVTPPLSRTTGFTFTFTLQVLREMHLSPHRAGVSLLILSDDRRGIELGFWEDRIWAQSDQPLFTHAEEVLWSTTADATEYSLRIRDDTYALTVEGEVLLTGPLRDYTAFDGPIDPYETPNIVFLGDNTASASGHFAWGMAHLQMPPVPFLTVSPDTGDAVELRWTWAPDVRLESALSLGGTWGPLEGVTVERDGEAAKVRWETVQGARLFRLRER